MTKASKTVRAALKNELGLNARMVSVKGGDNSLTVTIKVTHHPKTGKAISLGAVTEIVDRARVVNHCQSGEVLEGCNVFTRTDFDFDCVLAMLGADVAQAVKDLKASPGQVYQHKGVKVSYSTDEQAFMVDTVSGADVLPQNWNRTWDARHALRSMGVAILEESSAA